MKFEPDIYCLKALELIEQGENLFITGKAGTGKTTLLKYLVGQLYKRKEIVILAPTVVAAKNASICNKYINKVGATIHSFLHLPLGPYIPKMTKSELYNISPLDIDAVRSMDLMIIDEVSMVRSDLLDEMDDVLRHYRNNENPFGGVQIILLGDLYQLNPVVQDDEDKQLSDYYDSLNFFGSKAFKKIHCPMLELKFVYRQKGGQFIKLLNNVRQGKVFPQELKMLDSRYAPNYIPKDPSNCIRLTTHNRKAKAYNQERLAEISHREKEFWASTDGYFPSHEYPTDYCLVLKVGTSVMFVRNDNEGKRYVNGSLGTVTSYGYDSVFVKLDDTGKEVQVDKANWDLYKYHVNKTTKHIESVKCGSFRQLPLRHAWAVTIHKSQGLTFDNVIIDADQAFAPGHVYVALSRCRTFSGIRLATKITAENIILSAEVKNFMSNVERVIVEGEDELLATQEQSQLPKIEDKGAESILWMVEDGLDFDQIVEECGEREEVIFSRIAKLVELGYADVRNYIVESHYLDIRATLQRYYLDVKSIKIIQDKCLCRVKLGEILVTIASMKHGDSLEIYHQENKVDEVGFIDDEVFFAGSLEINQIDYNRQKKQRPSFTVESLAKSGALEKPRRTITITTPSKSKSGRIVIKTENDIHRYKPLVSNKAVYMLNYKAMSMSFENGKYSIVSAQNGYYLKSDSKYHFLSTQKSDQVGGRLTIKFKKDGSFAINHTDSKGGVIEVGSILISKGIAYFTDSDIGYTRQIKVID